MWPVIHEEMMTDGLSSELILPSSTIPVGIWEDDDVSLFRMERAYCRASPSKYLVMQQQQQIVQHYGT
jgi:hypothetical protein